MRNVLIVVMLDILDMFWFNEELFAVIRCKGIKKGLKAKAFRPFMIYKYWFCCFSLEEEVAVVNYVSLDVKLVHEVAG